MKYFSKILFFISTIIPFLNCFSQEKSNRIFYTHEWKVTTNKDSIAFYRIVTPHKNGYLVKDYYINDTLQMEGYYSDLTKEIKDGLFKFYRIDGTLSSQGYFKNGLREGVWRDFKNGKLWVEINYLHDKYEGRLTSFHSNGKIKRKEYYENGNFKSGNCFTKYGKDTLYYPFKIDPKFKGGEEEMYKFLSGNIIYPEEARKNKIEGKVIVRFYINVNGEIKDPVVISNTPEILNRSALRCLSFMPNWTSGLKDGEPVNIYFSIPFLFKLNE